MKLPFVTRTHHEEIKEMLEDRIDGLQKRYDALQAKADALAASVINDSKEREEAESKQEDSIGFAPKISDVRNAANAWARKRSKPS